MFHVKHCFIKLLILKFQASAIFKTLVNLQIHSAGRKSLAKNLSTIIDDNKSLRI